MTTVDPPDRVVGGDRIILQEEGRVCGLAGSLKDYNRRSA